ncbi:MAG: FAD-binding oxidoreductase [Nitrososphaera sp.]|jgi:FAD/FMN-containing dehydrogenase
MELQKLRNSIDGQVFTEEEILNYYSVDSSFYQVRPKVVVVPNNTADIIKTMRFATKNKISVTPRGAGTGLVGSALNDGIIVDMKNFDKIKIGKNFVVVGAGTTKGKLDQELAKHKKFLGPNPSVGPYCTIGGMIATNASGSRSIKYGSMIDNLLEVTIVTGKGKTVKLPSKSHIADSVLRLAKSIDKNRFPQVSKNSCGYRLDAVSNYNDSHKVISASEGTLGIIVSAKLRIFRLPQSRTLLVLGYHSIKEAINDCVNLVKLSPSALEFVDYSIMKNFKTKFPKRINCLLFVEFDSQIHNSIYALKAISAGKILRKLDDSKSIAKWWNFRNSALYFSLKNLLAGQSSPHIIEDAAVPIEKLQELILAAQKLPKMFGTKLVMYGHAGNGNIHIRLAMQKKNRATINKVAKVFFSRVIQLGGTITGEHGDGIARTNYVRLQYGTNNYKTFTKLKKHFDPKLILNPNKIIKIHGKLTTSSLNEVRP